MDDQVKRDDEIETDAESRSPAHTVWEKMGTTTLSATIEPAVGQVEVQRCGRPVRGEDYDCDDTWSDGKLRVRCGTAQVVIPANAVIGSIEEHVRETTGGPWTNPGSIGWCDWVGRIYQTLPDGRKLIGVTLKNWSHDRNRLARIIVHYNV